MAILKKLTTLLIINSLFLLQGCVTVRFTDPPTKFPPKPELLEYSKDPVVSYNKHSDTFVITSEYMHNSLQNDIFLKAILEWKLKNNIK